MQATKNQYELSQVLVRRGQEQFANKGDSDEKKESDSFFYWVMQQMEKEADKFCWSHHAYELSLRTSNFDNKLKVNHRGGYPSDSYKLRTMLNKKQFYKVIKEVAGIINALPNFTALYVNNDGFGNACLYVTMEIPL